MPIVFAENFSSCYTSATTFDHTILLRRYPFSRVTFVTPSSLGLRLATASNTTSMDNSGIAESLLWVTRLPKFNGERLELICNFANFGGIQNNVPILSIFGTVFMSPGPANVLTINGSQAINPYDTNLKRMHLVYQKNTDDSWNLYVFYYGAQEGQVTKYKLKSNPPKVDGLISNYSSGNTLRVAGLPDTLTSVAVVYDSPRDTLTQVDFTKAPIALGTQEGWKYSSTGYLEDVDKQYYSQTPNISTDTIGASISYDTSPAAENASIEIAAPASTDSDSYLGVTVQDKYMLLRTGGQNYFPPKMFGPSVSIKMEKPSLPVVAQLVYGTEDDIPDESLREMYAPDLVVNNFWTQWRPHRTAWPTPNGRIRAGGPLGGGYLAKFTSGAPPANKAYAPKLALPNGFGSRPATIECWFRRPAGMGAGGIFTLHAGDTQPAIYIKVSTNLFVNGVSGSSTIPVDQWCYLQVYLDGQDTCNVYVNGADNRTNITYPLPYCTNFSYGTGTSSNLTVSGYSAEVSHLRIVDGVHTPIVPNGTVPTEQWPSQY